MAIVIQKFGGTSLATPAHLKSAADRICLAREDGDQLVIVVSAMGEMTNELIDLASRTVSDPPEREMAMLLTTGERVSISLLAMALQERGVPSISFTGSQVGIITTNSHSDARILEIRPFRVVEELEKGKVVIIAGFQGVSREKEITTLGRGGSDTTAVALAAALGADRCDVLTDVDGIFTADPKIVEAATLIQRMSHGEAIEFSSLGAKMHPRSLELARRFDVSVRISNSKPSAEAGTDLGTELFSETGPMECTKISGIATKSGFSGFRVGLEIGQLSQFLSETQISVRFFTLGREEISFLCEFEKAPHVLEGLSSRNISYVHLEDMALVSVVGEGVCSTGGLLPNVLTVLQEEETDCFLIVANSLSLSVAIPAAKSASVTRRLHESLI